MTRKDRIRDIIANADQLDGDWHTAHDVLQEMKQAGIVQELRDR